MKYPHCHARPCTAHLLGRVKLYCTLYVRRGEGGWKARWKFAWRKMGGSAAEELSEWNSQDVVNSKNGRCEQEYLPSC